MFDLIPYKSKYKLENYDSYFSDALADSYKPIIYSNQCFSGPPKAVYYRILGMNGAIDEVCIQYLYYWDEQICILSSHRYDYEPIFLFVKEDEEKPVMIVNNGFASALCTFHKIEIRPKTGIRSENEEHGSEKMTRSPFYPYGGNGDISMEFCYKEYPLDGNDLVFSSNRPIFGIKACSNIFSGARRDLQGFVFDPRLLHLTDEILDSWYCEHNQDSYDMPFSHDLANPFSFPHIKYKRIKVIQEQFVSV